MTRKTPNPENDLDTVTTLFTYFVAAIAPTINKEATWDIIQVMLEEGMTQESANYYGDLVRRTQGLGLSTNTPN